MIDCKTLSYGSRLDIVEYSARAWGGCQGGCVGGGGSNESESESTDESC